MRKLFYILSTVLFLSSCEDSLQEPLLEVGFAPGIKVEDGVAIVKPNDPVDFTINGEMDLLYYYDGKVGCRYNVPDNREGGELTLFFASQFESIGQHENLSLWISTDFVDNCDSISKENFDKATWNQIPIEYTANKYKGNIHKGGTPEDGGGFPNSSQKIKAKFYSPWLNLFDYLPEGTKKFHLAFKYHSELPEATAWDENGKPTAYNMGTTWLVNWFDVRREYVNGTHAYYGLYSPVQTVNDHRDDLRYVGFRPYSIPREESASDSLRWATSSNYLKFSAQHNPNDATNNPTGNLYCDTDWAISREFIVNPDPEPEYSKVLKITTGDVPNSTSIRYEEPGEYTVTFIAKNYVTAGVTETIRELKVRVVDETAATE
jgi:hypothetical protein